MVKLYKPSSGSAGELFKENNCFQCEWYKWMSNIDYKGCPIELATTYLEMDDPDYPNQWQYNEDGKPICTAFRKKERKDEVEISRSRLGKG